MKDCGISTTALTLSFVTALPHFALEICVQNSFRLKYIMSIFFLFCESTSGFLVELDWSCWRQLSMEISQVLLARRGVSRFFRMDASRCFWLTFLRVLVDSLLQSLFRKKPKLVLCNELWSQSLLDCPTGVGKALVFTALCVILCSGSVE